MQCTSCNKDKQNGEVSDGKFICNPCLIGKMVKSLVKKPLESSIITALKRHGLRGDVAYGYYNNPEYPLSRLIKNIWLFRYIKSNGYKVANDVQKRNIDDMVDSGAQYSVFNCPACYAALAHKVAKIEIKPIDIIDLCRIAIGEK